jgi:hypothetical protein
MSSIKENHVCNKYKGKGEKSYQIPVKEFYESMNRVKSLKYTRTVA